ncbi:MAG: hypothetical protein E7297_04520 [Lachnospiraceae bacterium]|jgi:hypothetical protein|nr:hypothetical protein [Lachnospiraceae bacterium]
MNRFEKNSFLKTYRFRLIISGLLIVAFLVLFHLSLNSISISTRDNQRESLENALNRDIIQCYVLEGTYPPSLDYLKSHYGLTYDEDVFFVDYTPRGANLLPDITILEVHE